MSTEGLGGGLLLDPLIGKWTEQLLAVVTIFTTAGMVEMIFYGIHFILFWMCIFLTFRTKRSKQWFILAPVVVMFLLSTTDVACTFRLISHEIITIPTNPEKVLVRRRLLQAKDTLFVASNFLAELILIYRCYMIWGRPKYVLAVGSVFVIGDTIWGFISMGPTILLAPASRFVPVYIWNLFSINILITFLTILRIFLASRVKTRPRAEQVKTGGYQTAIIFLVESSVVYLFCLLIYIVYPKDSPTRIYLLAICFRVVGIMPTLLIVQVGLKSLKQKANTPTTLSQFQAGTKSIPLGTLEPSMFPDKEGGDDYSRSPMQGEEVEIDSIQEVASDRRNSVTLGGSHLDVSTINHTVVSSSDDTAPYRLR